MSLAADGVTVMRGETRAIADVTLRLSRGEMLGILGPNGAGKSTLLHALGGLLPVSEGSVRLDRRDLDDMDVRARARRIAVLPQGAEVHWPMSVENVVALGRLPHQTASRPTETDAVAIERAISRVGLESLRARRMDRLII